MDRKRLIVGLTHPVQYYSPWFRFIAKNVPELDLHVIYATQPTAEQQAVGFQRPFEWDVPLMEGYSSEVVRPPRATHRIGSESFWGLIVPEFAARIVHGRGDAILLPGWQSASLAMAIVACSTHRIPLLYRGDTTLRRDGGVRAALSRTRAKAFLNRFSAFLSVGRGARRFIESFGTPPSRIFSSPHFVDNGFFMNAAALASSDRTRKRIELGLDADEFVAVFVGKLTRNKRVEDLIRAAHASRARLAVLIVGSGEEEDALRALARALEVRCVFTGFVNQSAIGQMYGVADCFVLPSASETWGLAANEAMAAGLPVILSNGVGAAEDLVVEGETGFMYPAGNYEALAAALEKASVLTNVAGTVRGKVAEYSIESATEGLLNAVSSLRSTH